MQNTIDNPLTELSFRKPGDSAVFQRLAEPYRRELQLHCYRMLGSYQDAEDLVQETLLRAWRGFDDFEGRASFRRWLYRIATNTCLNALARHKGTRRRVMPEGYGPPADRPPEGTPATEIAWLEPYPDTMLENIADAAPGPAARYEMREAVHLAFVKAIQYLPPRQRAVLLLRDVLGWSAEETAGILDTSLASVNSALQRARATLEKGRKPTGTVPPEDAGQRDLLERYVRAWEGSDLDSLVALLREEAILSMPPWQQWYQGRESIRSFLAWAWESYGRPCVRLVPAGLNGQPGFALYLHDRGSDLYRVYQLQALTLSKERGEIAALTLFFDPVLFAAFGLPETISVQES